jgi:hypothetical protein
MVSVAALVASSTASVVSSVALSRVSVASSTALVASSTCWWVSSTPWGMRSCGGLEASSLCPSSVRGARSRISVAAPAAVPRFGWRSPRAGLGQGHPTKERCGVEILHSRPA